MRTSVVDRIAKLILLVLPIVILWAVLPRFDPRRIVPETPSTAPRWVEDGRHYNTCSDAMNGATVPDVATLQSLAINRTRATAIGAGVIESQTDIRRICQNALVSFEPKLVQKQFADGQTRLAWVYGEGCGTDKNFMTGTAEFAYIDATTGEPLLLIKDMFAPDPSFTCPQLAPLERYFQTVKLFGIGIAITVAYLITVLIAAFILRRRRKAQEALEIHPT